MAISKVTLNGVTQMDVTQDSVTEETLLSGETATKSNGVRTTGTLDLPVGVGEPYDGVDLTTKFASEITTAGNAWSWIQGRITSGDFSGIHVGDYIPFTCTNTAATTLNAKIIGINTYKGFGSPAVGNHIDFWAGLWPTATALNPGNYNNGTSVAEYPWRACEAYLFANSLSGNVPSTATANPTMVAKDYTSGGIYYYLPTALKNVIVEKIAQLEKRYTSGSLLTESNGWGYTTLGKIWFPSELEVFGTVQFSKAGYATAGFVVYPYFLASMHRVSGDGSFYWLLNPVSGGGYAWCNVASIGYASTNMPSTSTIKAPVCFRIA